MTVWENRYPRTFGHRPIYICGEAATTTLNPEPCILNPFSYCKTQMNSL